MTLNDLERGNDRAISAVIELLIFMLNLYIESNNVTVYLNIGYSARADPGAAVGGPSPPSFSLPPSLSLPFPSLPSPFPSLPSPALEVGPLKSS